MSKPRLIHRVPSPAALLTAVLLLGAVSALAGCNIAGLLGSMVGETVKAKHKLVDQRTLVVVDDRQDEFGAPGVTAMIAKQIQQALRENEVLVEARFVPQQELRDLARQLDANYPQEPLAELGRKLNAKQVIHVDVRSVRLRKAPNVYRPRMTARVKVLDTQAGRRVFPAPDGPSPSDGPTPGYELKTQMSVRTIESNNRGALTELRREAALHLGRAAARLFYDHAKPTSG